MKTPSSRRNLDAALQRIASGNREGYWRVRSVVANTVVAQMLPDGAVKGGSGLKLQLGNKGHALSLLMGQSCSALL